MRAQSILDSPKSKPHESEIADAVFQSEKFIRGEPVESCELRYFNSFEFFDHTGSERGRHWSVVAAADSPSPLQSPFPWLWSLCPPSASRWLRSIGVPKFAMT